MKLATRYQRINLLVTFGIFLLASIAFYFLLHSVLIFQVDEDLEIEQHEIQAYVSRFGTLPLNVVQVADQLVRFEPTTKPLPKPVHQTTVLWDEVEKERGRFRQLLFTIRAGGQWYRISVSKSLEASDGLERSIGLIALGTVALMLLVSLLINRIVLRSLWQPFYTTISHLRHFKLNSKDKLVLPSTAIEEFRLLNTVLETTTGKAIDDYTILKEFTENASHELQTPLAVIRSKLDLLIQDEGLSAAQSDIIHDTYRAIGKMTYLNQSLLMLAKIGNGQYAEKEPVDMQSLLQEQLTFFETFLVEKSLTTQVDLQTVAVDINPALAELLLNNLLTNAINHNYTGGHITLSLTTEELSISNTSTHKELPAAGLFNRFHKIAPGGTGLGLALVRQACDASGFRIRYTYDQHEQHCFTIFWTQLT